MGKSGGKAYSIDVSKADQAYQEFKNLVSSAIEAGVTETKTKKKKVDVSELVEPTGGPELTKKIEKVTDDAIEKANTKRKSSKSKSKVQADVELPEGAMMQALMRTAELRKKVESGYDKLQKNANFDIDKVYNRKELDELISSLTELVTIQDKLGIKTDFQKELANRMQWDFKIEKTPTLNKNINLDPLAEYYDVLFKAEKYEKYIAKEESKITKSAPFKKGLADADAYIKSLGITKQMLEQIAGEQHKEATETTQAAEVEINAEERKAKAIDDTVKATNRYKAARAQMLKLTAEDDLSELSAEKLDAKMWDIWEEQDKWKDKAGFEDIIEEYDRYLEKIDEAQRKLEGDTSVTKAKEEHIEEAKAAKNIIIVQSEASEKVKKTTQNVRELDQEVKKMASDASKAGKELKGDNSPFGWIRNQKGYLTDFVSSYKVALSKVQDAKVTRFNDEGDVATTVEYTINLDKLGKEILRTDKEILNLEYKIRDAKGDTSGLKENLGLLNAERESYEKILSDVVNDPRYAADKSQVEILNSQRALQEERIKNNQLAKDSEKLLKEQTAETERQKKAAEQLAEAQRKQTEYLSKQKALSQAKADRNQAQYDSSKNALLQKQLDLYTAIQKKNFEIEKAKYDTKVNTGHLANLQDEKKALQEQFIETKREIQALGEEGAITQQLSQYTQVRVKWEREIADLQANQQKNADAEKQRADAEAQAKAEKDRAEAIQQRIAAQKESGKAVAAERAKAGETDAEKLSLIEKQIDAYKKLLAVRTEIAKLKTDLSSDHSTKIADLEKEEASLKADVVSYDKQIRQTGELANNVGRIAKLEAERSEYNKVVSGYQSDAIDKMLGGASKSTKRLDNLLLSDEWMPDFRDRLQALRADYTDFVNNVNTMNFDQAKSKYQSLSQSMDEAIGEKGMAKYKVATERQLSNLSRRIEQIMAKNTAMGKEFQEKWKNLRLRLNTTKSVEDLQRVVAEVNRLDAEMAKAGKTGQRFVDMFGTRLKSLYATFLARYLSGYQIVNYVKRMVGVIRELDDALLDLKKTAQMSKTELEGFYYNSSDIARQMGVTTEEIISQAAAWSRLGYSTAEAATEMAAMSSQFAQISPGMTVDKATDGLVSTMKAFHVDVADVESEIMDKINIIGNRMATTNEEVVDMLERSSAAMNEANNSLEQTIALESAAVQITRNAETTGTAFRTISMRIRGIDEETEEASADLEQLKGKIADLTKTAKTPNGVSLFTDEAKTQYKSTYQILKDISEIYHDLTDKEQAQLLETLAGKRGGQVLAGILNDFSEVERAMQEMAGAAGSADKELGIVQETISYKINSLKQLWVSVLQDILKREDINRFVDNLIKISDVLAEIIKNLGAIKSLGIVATLVGLFKKRDSIVGGFSSLVEKGTVLQSLKNPINDFKTLGETLKGVSAETVVAEMTTKKYGESQIKATLRAMGLTDQMVEEAVAANANAAANGKATLATSKLGKAFTGLKASMTGTALGVGSIIAVLTAVVIAVKKTKQANEELRESAREMGEKFVSSKKEISEYKDEVAKLHEKLKDGNTSYEESKTARERLLEIQDDLIAKYGSEAEAIGLITDAINGEVDAFDRLTEVEWQKTKNKFNNQNLPGWDWMNQRNYGVENNIGVMLAEMEKASKSFRLDTKNTEFAKEVAKLFGGTVGNINGDVSHMYLSFEGNLDEIYDDLLQIQILAEQKGIKIEGLDDAVTDTEELLSYYQEIYDQYNLYERIFPNEEYTRAYNEINKLSKAYSEAFMEGDEAAQKAAKQGVVQVLEEIRDEMGDLSPDEEAVLNTLSGLGTFAQDEINKWNLKADIDFGVNNAHKPIFRQAQDVLKNQISDLIMSFGSEQTLLHKQFAQGSNLEDSYNKLDAYARSHNATVEELVETYKELGLLKDEFFISPDLKRTVDNLIEGQTIDSRIEGTKQLNARIKELDEEEQEIWLRFAEDYTGSWWEFLEDFEREVERVKSKVKANDSKETELTAKEALEQYKFEDPTGEKDSISGMDYLDNYYSKVRSIQEAVQKLRSGDATRDELSQLRREYNLTGESAAELARQLERTITSESEATIRYIDRVIEQYPYLEDFFENEKRLIRETADEAKGLESALTGGAKAINDVQTLKSGFDMIGSIYNDIKDKEDFDWSSIINNADFEKTFKSCGEAYENFLKVVEESPDDIEAAQDAIDKLATAFYYDNIGNFSTATKEEIDAITDMLKQMGVTNAEEVVKAQIEIEKSAKLAEESAKEINEQLSNIDINNIDFSEGFKSANENLANEYKKIKEWGLGDIENDIVNKTIQTKFGNVDMDKRAIIRWSDELKKTYEDALKSWNYDPEVGGIDSVFGGYGTYSMRGGDIAVAYTPILNKDDGTVEVLSYNTLDNYIQSVLEQAEAQVKASGDAVTDEAVIKKAFEIDLEGISVDKLDSQGRKVGETFVKSVIAGIGDSEGYAAEQVGDIMHFVGEAGAIEQAKDWIDAYHSLKQKLSEGTLELTNITANEIAILQQEAVVSGAAAQQMALLALQKQLTNAANIQTSDDVANLYALALQGGATAEVLEALMEVMNLMGEKERNVRMYIKTGEESFMRKAKELDSAINSQIQQIQSSISNPTEVELDFDAGGKNTKNAGGAGKDAGDAYVDAFEKELEKLKKAYERGDLTLKDYLAQWKALIDKYFANNPKYAEEYANRVKEYLDAVKGYYSSAISGVTTILNGRISALQKQKDKAIKALEKEKEAALAVYDAQIKAIEKTIKAKQKQIKQLEKEKKAIEAKKKPLEDEIKAIQDANEERDRQLQLQKDLYELEKLQNQRTQLVKVLPTFAVMR